MILQNPPSTHQRQGLPSAECNNTYCPAHHKGGERHDQSQGLLDFQRGDHLLYHSGNCLSHCLAANQRHSERQLFSLHSNPLPSWERYRSNRYSKKNCLGGVADLVIALHPPGALEGLVPGLYLGGTIGMVLPHCRHAGFQLNFCSGTRDEYLKCCRSSQWLPVIGMGDLANATGKQQSNADRGMLDAGYQTPQLEKRE
jgi:hypothetical protein